MQFIDPEKYEQHLAAQDEEDNITGATSTVEEYRVPETCFWIDVNIDGVQLFKNSTRSQVNFKHVHRNCF
jgi:hypothetical protein